MFTWDAVQQIVADHRGQMVAQASASRALRQAPARSARVRRHFSSGVRATGPLATLHRL